MDVVILCGGFGSRLSEETILKPKPMVEIGGKPLLWHIMKYYSIFGYKRFILPLGYKGEYIKKYFYDFRITQKDFSISLGSEGKINFINEGDESDWEITMIDTGLNTLKGGRLHRIAPYIKSDDFFVTYGDGLSDVNLDKLLEFHKVKKRIASLTAVRPPSRFGEIDIQDSIITSFSEKPQMHEGYINGGFFVFNKSIFNYLDSSDSCDLEFGAMQILAEQSQLAAYKHEGFWQCMDNIREKKYLEQLIDENKAPWIKW